MRKAVFERLLRPAVPVYLLVAVLSVSVWQAAMALVVGLADSAAPLRLSDRVFAVLLAVFLVGCVLMIRRSAAVGAWMLRDPRWGWPVLAATIASYATVALGWVLGVTFFFLAKSLPLWGLILIAYHGLAHPAYWKKVGRFLIAADGHRLSYVVAPLVFTPIFYVLLHAYNAWMFDIVSYPKGGWIDLALQIGIAYFLLAFCRSLPVVILSHLLLMSLIYIGNAVKHSFLGGPIGPDDVASLKELVVILKGWQKMLVVVPLASFVLVFGLNIRWRKIASPIAAAVLAAGLVVLYARPEAIVTSLDREYRNYSWDQWYNCRLRGEALYFLGEYARRIATSPPVPSAEEVVAAHARLGVPEPTDLAPPIRDPRTVYMIVVESFWDPSVLTAAKLTGPVLDPAFEELWDAAGRSRALSPTSFGETANAEYELLCGLPELTPTLFFQNGVRYHVPCLPALLDDNGYESIAFHPNIPDFWNRKNVYPRLGFDLYLAKRAFVFDDMNGDFLSDESLFRQVRSRLAARPQTKPRFVYILTISGHYNYHLNPDKRPPVLEAASGDEFVDEVVGHYANSIHYTSKELADFIAALRAQDPRALIVVAGDHLPFLGKDRAAYRQSNVLADSAGDYTPTMLHDHVATPLLVIDGERGPLAVGDLPMYEIPTLVFRLLAGADPWMTRYEPPDGLLVRNVNNADLIVGPDGIRRACRPADTDAVCLAVRAWKEAIATVTADIMLGDQHTLY